MIRSSLTRSILAVAAGTVLFTSAFALAQQRVGNDGRALDANPRIDSGGFNSGGIPANSVITGNQIVTGNITGGGAFRGFVPYTDAREFRGNVAGIDFDQFIARSAGAPQPYTAQGPVARAEPFYGRRLAEAPPAGFVQNGATGTFVATGTQTPNQNNLDNRLNNRVEPPKPSDLLLPGPVDPQTNLPTMLSASPLLGIRQWKSSDAEDREFVRTYSSMRQDSALDRLRLDPMLIRQMRDELSTNVDETTGEKIEPRRPGQVTGELPKPFDAPQNDPVNNRLNSAVQDKPLPGDVRPDGGMYRRMLLPPSQQSQQYAELEKRLRRYYEDRLQTDEEKNREFLKELRARDMQEQAGTNAGGPALANMRNQANAAIPDYARIGQELGASKAPGPQNPADVLNTPIPNRPKPQKITSLATGVQAPGLAKLLKTAEDLMRDKKYAAALDQYEAAAQLARNNSMVLLGQANAELAVGFYRKAEQHLRFALRNDPVILMAQFDLKGLLGPDKLDTIVRDLKDVAVKQERDAGAPLLLAYIAYNTGNEAGAAMYLDVAQKRSEGRDDLPRILRQHWDLPGPTTRPAK